MADLMTVSFILCAITAVAGSVAVLRRNKKQVRLFFGISLLSLLIVVASMVALSLSGGS